MLQAILDGTWSPTHFTTITKFLKSTWCLLHVEYKLRRELHVIGWSCNKLRIETHGSGLSRPLLRPYKFLFKFKYKIVTTHTTNHLVAQW